MALIFQDLHLSEGILQTIKEIGYETPTEVQAKVIPHVLIGRDVVALAQTGTGKTAAYALPMIDILSHGRAKVRMPRSLVLVPTRELAHQVAQDFAVYSAAVKLDTVVLVGGESIVDQQKILSRGVDILVATPGRLLDLITRGQLILTDTKLLVLDEADRMLDMGFLPDIEVILTSLPVQRQTLLLSATMPPAIGNLIKRFLNSPKEISLVTNSVAITLNQRFISVHKDKKLDQLQDVLKDFGPDSKGFIFCNRKKDVDLLGKQLGRGHLQCLYLHGDMSQSERTKVIEAFRQQQGGFLVATDIAARGLDIDDVDFVVNFDIPIHAEDYVHRIGRAGRAGRKGVSLSLVQPEDIKTLKLIFDLTKAEAIEAFLKESEGLRPQNAPDARARGTTHERRSSKKSDAGRPTTPSVKRSESPPQVVSDEPKLDEPKIVLASSQELPAHKISSASEVCAPSADRPHRPHRSPAHNSQDVRKPASDRPRTPSSHSSPRSFQQANAGGKDALVGFGDDLPQFMKAIIKIDVDVDS